MRILFTMPKSFIRTACHTNPFFDPLIAVCEKKAITWHVLCPCPRASLSYGAEHVVDGRWLEWFGIWFWRLHRLFCKNADPLMVYRRLGRLLKYFPVPVPAADIVVTISGQFAEELKGFFPRAHFTDLQHGIFLPSNNQYFEQIIRAFGDKRCRYWTFGEVFRSYFPESMRNRVLVIGDVLRGVTKAKYEMSLSKRKRVVLALQLTPSSSMNERKILKSVYEEFIEGAYEYADKFQLVVRHHPRFKNAVDLSEWNARYPKLQYDNLQLDESLREAFCCVTISSCIAFDAAVLGVPTLLLDATNIKDWNFMESVLKYPFPRLTFQELVSKNEAELSCISLQVKRWYETFYAPFTEAGFLEVLERTGEDVLI